MLMLGIIQRFPYLRGTLTGLFSGFDCRARVGINTLVAGAGGHIDRARGQLFPQFRNRPGCVGLGVKPRVENLEESPLGPAVEILVSRGK